MDIKQIILKAIYGKLSDDERRKLEVWLGEAGNRGLYDRIRGHLESRDAVQFLAEVDVERALGRIRRRRRKAIVTISSLVAGIAAVVLVTVLLWPVVQTVPVKVESQSHGATIVLSNGEEVRLGDTVLNHRLREANIDVANGEIKVQATNVETKVESKVIAYNTLKVPHGESYSITLADGTRVWVNALSSLKFPSSFEGSAERIVELVGEGFFEVARDTVHPFRVKTVNQTIVVTGTAFNVEAYVGEVSRTTLCQGQVIVEASVGKPVFLSPGQQLSVDKQGEVVVAEVNTDVYTSWIRGEYYFDNQTLDQVLLELGKWFEIKEVIFFDPALERQLFSGKFKKSDGLETILKVIERGVGAEINCSNGQIRIGKK